jgi:hypothetical protein
VVADGRCLNHPENKRGEEFGRKKKEQNKMTEEEAKQMRW